MQTQYIHSLYMYSRLIAFLLSLLVLVHTLSLSLLFHLPLVVVLLQMSQIYYLFYYNLLSDGPLIHTNSMVKFLTFRFRGSSLLHTLFLFLNHCFMMYQLYCLCAFLLVFSCLSVVVLAESSLCNSVFTSKLRPLKVVLCLFKSLFFFMRLLIVQLSFSLSLMFFSFFTSFWDFGISGVSLCISASLTLHCDCSCSSYICISCNCLFISILSFVRALIVPVSSLLLGVLLYCFLSGNLSVLIFC